MSPPEPSTVPALSTLADHAATDPNRTAAERESQVSWAVDTDRAHVETTEPALIRRWVNLDHFTLKWFVAHDGDGYREYGPAGDQATWLAAWNDAGRPGVVQIVGSVPIGAVVVKTVPRVSDGHSGITSGSVMYGDGGEQ